MEKTLFKLGSLLLLGVGVLLTFWGILPFKISYITFVLATLGIIFLWRSLHKQKEKQRIRKKVVIIAAFTTLWGAIVPYSLYEYTRMIVEDIILSAVVFGIIALAIILYFVMEEFPDVDRDTGNYTWGTLSRKTFSYILLATISFTTAMISSFYAWWDVSFTNVISICFLLVGIISSRRT